MFSARDLYLDILISFWCTSQHVWLEYRFPFLIGLLGDLLSTGRRHPSQTKCCLKWRLVPSSVTYTRHYVGSQIAVADQVRTVFLCIFSFIKRWTWKFYVMCRSCQVKLHLERLTRKWKAREKGRQGWEAVFASSLSFKITKIPLDLPTCDLIRWFCHEELHLISLSNREMRKNQRGNDRKLSTQYFTSW